jgi:hypothetical protein
MITVDPAGTVMVLLSKAMFRAVRVTCTVFPPEGLVVVAGSIVVAGTGVAGPVVAGAVVAGGIVVMGGIVVVGGVVTGGGPCGPEHPARTARAPATSRRVGKIHWLFMGG